jgi:hypothetical protein
LLTSIVLFLLECVETFSGGGGGVCSSDLGTKNYYLFIYSFIGVHLFLYLVLYERMLFLPFLKRASILVLIFRTFSNTLSLIKVVLDTSVAYEKTV